MFGSLLATGSNHPLSHYFVPHSTTLLLIYKEFWLVYPAVIVQCAIYLPLHSMHIRSSQCYPITASLMCAGVLSPICCTGRREWLSFALPKVVVHGFQSSQKKCHCHASGNGQQEIASRRQFSAGTQVPYGIIRERSDGGAAKRRNESSAVSLAIYFPVS